MRTVPEFLYHTLGPTGKATRGKIEASNRDTAIRQLMERGENLLDLNELGAERFDWSRLAPQPGKGGTRKALMQATTQLATLLEAGIMLDQALILVSKVTADKPLRSGLERVREDMRSGFSISDAVAAREGVFPSFYAGLLRAGESGAGLDFAFRQLATYLKQSFEISNRIRSALIYPVILMGLILVTLLIVFFYVLPQFRDIFASAGDRLPASTRTVLAISDHLEQAGWIYIVLLAFGLLILQWAVRRPAFMRLWHGLILSPRFLFGLPRKMEASRFCRTAGTLFKGGMAAPAVLITCQSIAQNSLFAHKVGEIEVALREGSALSDALPKTRILPDMALQMVEIGERSAKLGEMMLAAAEMLDEDIRTAVDRLLAAMVPVLTILMGLIVATVIGALMVGIVSMNRLAF